MVSDFVIGPVCWAPLAFSAFKDEAVIPQSVASDEICIVQKYNEKKK